MNVSIDVSVNDSLLYQLNEATIKLLIPNTILVAVIFAVSLFGNGVVLYVYAFRMRTRTDDRYFIPWLAVSDMYTCLVGSLFGIVLNSNPLMFRYNFACSLVWTLNGIGAISSAFMLLTIAIQRYMKVCKPFNSTMSLTTRRFALFAVIVVSFLLSLPSMFLYGEAEIQITSGSYNLTGYNCGATKEANKTVLFGYSIVFMAVGLTGVLSMGILYYKILQTIYKQQSFRKKTRSLHTTNCQTSNQLRVEQRSASNIEKDKISNSPSVSQDGQLSSNDFSVTQMKAQVPNGRNNNKRKLAFYKRAMKKHRISILFLLLTVLFLVTYFPRIVLMIIESINSDFWKLMSNTEYVISLSLYRAYLLNNVVNPFIYYFFDTSFKAAISDVFCHSK